MANISDKRYREIEFWLKKIADHPIERITYIETGLTNDNYLVDIGRKQIVIRIPKVGNELIFDYRVEAKVLNLIKPLKLEPNLYLFDPKTGVKITEYIPTTKHFAPQYIEEAADLIRKLHQSKQTIGIPFKLVEEFEKYRAATKQNFHDLSLATDYLYRADQYDDERILCHNDLVEGNFLFTPAQEHYLIDYEYARDNDPFFDLMSFITENDIQDLTLRDRFYRRYFGRTPTIEEYLKLRDFEAAHHVLWCQWGMMMHGMHGDKIYREIADLKYRRLTEFIALHKTP